ncbi:MAG: RND family efflux transporter MFP subunit [Pseudohongiellaceae bacterium]
MRQHHQQGSIGVFLIVVIGVAVMAGLWFFKPKPSLRPKIEVTVPLVDVIQAHPGQYRATIISQGTVVPKRQIKLVSEVAGRVVEVSSTFDVGFSFKADQLLVALDDRDYRHGLAVANTKIVVAERELALEQGQARQAKRVWRDLGSDSANALALREPQLNAAKAGLRAATVERDQAMLKVERTRISVPFDGRIQTKSVALGEYVSAGTSLAMVYGSEAVEVRLPLNNQQLALAGLAPGKDAASDLQSHARPDVLLSATIGDDLYRWPISSMRMDVVVDEATRFYYLIVEIKEPFDSANFEQPLLVGLFVKAKISGKLHENVIRVPKKALVDDAHIFVVNADNQLSLRAVEIIDRQQNTVIIKSDAIQGEQVVVSDTRVLTSGLTVEVNEISSAPLAIAEDTDIEKSKISAELKRGGN